MSIDKVTTPTPTPYVTGGKRTKSKFTVDGIVPADGAPKAADEESRGRRDQRRSGRRKDPDQKGTIDERI